jgi:hypothetical protein
VTLYHQGGGGEEDAVVQTDESEEEDEVAEVVIEVAAPGSAPNTTDDEDTNEEGKKPKAIPRKATPQAPLQNPGRPPRRLALTAPGGVVFLKDAEREGRARRKKTIRRFTFGVDRGTDESQVRYAYSILPAHKLDAGELVDKIEELSQTRKDLKDTKKRQL